VDGRRLVFAVEASDGVDVVSRGRLERVVVTREAFDARLDAKVT
jgi:fluoroacetyl-CoA thioesterase